MSRDQSVEMFWVMCLGIGGVLGCVVRMLAIEVSGLSVLFSVLALVAVSIFLQIARDEWQRLTV